MADKRSPVRRIPEGIFLVDLRSFQFSSPPFPCSSSRNFPKRSSRHRELTEQLTPILKAERRVEERAKEGEASGKRGTEGETYRAENRDALNSRVLAQQWVKGVSRSAKFHLTAGNAPTRQLLINDDDAPRSDRVTRIPANWIS